MDCLICLEPIRGAPFQSRKRLTCSCKVSTHEHCYREYRAAKGHTECIICHNCDYVRQYPTPPLLDSDNDEVDAGLVAFQVQLATALSEYERERPPPVPVYPYLEFAKKALAVVAVVALAYIQARLQMSL